MPGTTLQAPVDRAVDGDTLRVMLDGESESLRILAIDTEESRAGAGKPVTQLGLDAKVHAEGLFPAGKQVTIEFPGTEPVEECLKRYRGNFGRPLVYVHVDGMDFQEHMIELGFSPYFTKYGRAHFPEPHARYVAAERRAQARRVGIWDPEHRERNYPVLGAWWELRAAVIDEFRRARADGAEILNSRLDFAAIVEAAEQEREAVVFTELRDVQRVGSRSAILGIGSREQPFKLFLPDIEGAIGQKLVSLLEGRYVSAGSDGRTVASPRRSYAYVSGPMKMFRGEPEVVVSRADQVQDAAP